MYLKLDSYFLEENSDSIIQLFNGTFDESENVIDHDRMIDASIVAGGTRSSISDDQWTEKDTTTTLLNFKTGNAGTYVIGVSTKARSIEMKADAFNKYLEHDGVIDMLESRKANDLLEQDAVEKYSKHVKTIVQVGDSLSDDWNSNMGYPIEFIPLANPYSLNTGDELEVQLLRDGQPLKQQLVYANYKPSLNGHTHGNDVHEHQHEHDGDSHSHDHNHDDGEHTHDHENDNSSHTHQHEHDGESHSHGHSHDDGEHTHDHENDNSSHTHQHEHDGESHSHGHSHDDGEHTHDHENDNSSHTHQHEHDGESHSHGNSYDDGEHTHDHDTNIKIGDKAENDHEHTEGIQLRTNDNGEIVVPLDNDGIYYLRTIHLVESQEDGLTHESNWATLTFEITHGHKNDHGHDHEHNEDEIPIWLFVVASIIVVGGLFFFFNRKK
jgi:uncharacterized GH25 family protein